VVAAFLEDPFNLRCRFVICVHGGKYACRYSGSTGGRLEPTTAVFIISLTRVWLVK